MRHLYDPFTRELFHDKERDQDFFFFHTNCIILESHKNCFKVQDAYTLRCIPQVHGIVHDTIEFARSILNVEINSATDNPLIFPDKGKIISGGNFHGEYPAKVLDYLAIAIHEIAQMSERRLVLKLSLRMEH